MTTIKDKVLRARDAAKTFAELIEAIQIDLEDIARPANVEEREAMTTAIETLSDMVAAVERGAQHLTEDADEIARVFES